MPIPAVCRCPFLQENGLYQCPFLQFSQCPYHHCLIYLGGIAMNEDLRGERRPFLSLRVEQAASEAGHVASAQPPARTSASKTIVTLPYRGSIGRYEISPSNILRFPAEIWAPGIWRKKIGHVADVVNRRRTEKDRARYWSDTVATLAGQLHRRGATASEIETQVRLFEAAVSVALRANCRRPTNDAGRADLFTRPSGPQGQHSSDV